jgi:RNA polymerase sigma factor (sigma-70 family)
LEGRALIKGIKQKNRKAQKELYEQYQEHMFRLCYRYTGNVHDAEDMVVEGFLKIFEKIGFLEYRGESSFVNWMKTIMVNECLMLLRKNKRVYFVESDLVVEQENDFDSSIELKEIFQVMDLMPDGYRAVFNLFVIEGYSHQEISEKLEINVQTSKSQLSRAKKFLEKLIKDMNYERRAVS